MENTLSIIGYGGHSYVCIDAAIIQGYKVEGYYEIEEKNFNPFGLKYLGDENQAVSLKNTFISIGDNLLREHVFKRIYQKMNKKVKIIHPSSVVSDLATISEQVLVCASATINPLAKIGLGSIINTGSIIEHECEIGEFSHVAPNATLCGNVIVGKNTLVGANTTILPNIKIGQNVIIGSGSVVTKDVPSNTKVIGIPAKSI
jgi:sugar O-acyltransferase (sialic acid O-acetyltransferase NeuD family)